VQPASPGQPIPASWLIENRGFDNNNDGWTNGPESINNGVAEFLETTFNTYQTLPKLPVGNYLVTLNAFQRPGTAQDSYTEWTEGNEAVKAQLYATAGGSTVYQTVQNIWDGACETKKAGTSSNVGDLYVPSNTVAAGAWFADGCYENQLPVNLTTASTLKMGIRSTKSGASWWTCYDNFELLFFGPYDAETGIISISQEEGKGEAETSWHTLNGTKLSGKPTKRGVYIRGGKKILY
jgi:hypothetical protein